MKSLRTLGAALAAALLLAALPAAAQMDTAYTPGAPILPYGPEGVRASYSASAVALVPAASATDIACISGAASKIITLTRVSVGGTAGTAVTTPVLLVSRAALDTAGTAATGTALPVAAKHRASDPASAATLTAYTANPTVNDSSPGRLRAASLALPAAATTTVNNVVEWSFANRGAAGPKLQKNAAAQFCVNLNAATVTSGSLTVDFEWTEE